MGYDHRHMMDDIHTLESTQGTTVEVIGKSVMERDIPCLIAGSGEKRVLLNGAHHGLEYLTALFLVRFCGELEERSSRGQDFLGFDARGLLKKCTVYIIPMVNPDGVDIAVNGLNITDPHHRRLISLVGIHSFGKVWQANARGVDINHNYNALWSAVAEKPAPTRYGGEYPESEPETRAVVQFIRRIQPDLLIAFHSQGRELYYDFDGMTARRSRELAEKMAAESGYAVCVPTGCAAFGGCKDWFIKEYGREGFTVEIGAGKNPLPESMLADIYEENARMTLRAIYEL